LCDAECAMTVNTNSDVLHNDVVTYMCKWFQQSESEHIPHNSVKMHTALFRGVGVTICLQ